MADTAHVHREYVAGCYRCDLSRAEVEAAEVGEPEQPTCEHGRTEPHRAGVYGLGNCPGPAAETPDERR